MLHNWSKCPGIEPLNDGEIMISRSDLIKYSCRVESAFLISSTITNTGGFYQAHNTLTLNRWFFLYCLKIELCYRGINWLVYCPFYHKNGKTN